MNLTFCGILLSLLLAFPAGAQQGVSFGGLSQDVSLPVEIESDTLTVRNADGTAVFSGDVVAMQGDLRLSAPVVQVEYAPDGRNIARLHASGGVMIASATDAAEAREAVYTIDTGTVVMTGDVLLTQGQNALAGQKLRLDLKNGTGVMEGRVSTTLQPQKGR